MEITLLILYVDEFYFGDVKRNSPIYSRRGEMIPLVDEPHVHIIPMDGVNKFIYKNGHIQTLVLMRNNHLFIRFEKRVDDQHTKNP